MQTKARYAYKNITVAILVIVMAITLVTAGSFAANAEAVKTKIKHHKRSSTGGTTGGGSTGTSTLGSTNTGTTGGGSTGPGPTGGPGSLSKFISCIRGAASSSTALGSTTTTGKVSGKLTRSEVTNCYDTVYGGTGSSGIGGGSGTRSSSSVSGAGSSGGGSFPLTGPTGGTP